MRSLFVIAFVFCCISCDNFDLNSFFTKNLLKDIPNNKNYNYYVIVPQAGCPGCVTDAEDFILQNRDSNKYLFIITNYSSKKALRLKLGNEILKYNNVILDSTNSYYARDFKENIYPISIKLNQNKIDEIIIGIP